MNVDQKDEMIAFDRERRVYKDAYVENFRRVRHFPSLATIGAGRADNESIILVQESHTPNSLVKVETPRSKNDSKSVRLKTDPAYARVNQQDSLDEIFQNASPLSNFRASVMCKHSNAQKGRHGTTPPSNDSVYAEPGKSPRYSKEKAAFKPSGSTEAKATIERRLTYDGDEFIDQHKFNRSPPAPSGKPQWTLNNPIHAKQNIRNTAYFHSPPEGAIEANRTYTQAFIKQHVEAYQHSRRRRANAQSKALAE